MQITVNIPDELAAQAQAQGLTPESYVEKLIAEQNAVRGYGAGGKLTREEFNACLDRMTQYSDKIPVLPDEAFTRESFYSDHD